ncbi:MAG: elongation factor G [Candidatus Woesebacteria bacterium]
MAQTTVKTTNRDLPLDRIRNIGIIAHIDAGKTTTSERILFYTGKSYKIGDIDDGDTQMDWMEQEKERGITIVSAATTTFWTPVLDTVAPHEPYRINLIDTPGHVDFTAEVERSLRVLDGGITVLDGEEGVQSQSETVWRQADKYNVPRICFVNKMDKLGADFLRTVEDIRNKFGVKPAVMALPIGVENTFRGIVLLLDRKALVWAGDETGAMYTVSEEIPEEMKSDVEEHRAKLVEAIAETDDALLEKYFAGEEIPVNDLKKALRKAVIEYKLVPIFCGSSLRNKGVQPLLDAVVEYLPSPVDIGEIKGVNPETDAPEVRKLVPEEKFCGLAFKIQTDPHVGRITYVRIYSGKLAAGTYAYNSSKGEKERIGRLLLMHANQREEITEALAGEIVAVVGLKNTKTGDTLCDENFPIILEGISFADPVISMAIEPKTKNDQEKMGMALGKLLEEDPTFKVAHNDETGQTTIAGMGELHLEILIDRMKREFGVEANTGAPQVAYKEAIKKEAEGEGKYIKQSGGRGQYGHCWLKVEPKDRGTGFEWVNAIKGASIPREFINPIEKGVKEAMENGVLAGFPMVDIRVTVFDGSYHEVDSSEMSFKIAGSMAFQAAVKQADMCLLEPIMQVEVTTPSEFMGDVIGDLSSKRAQIQGSDQHGTAVVIRAMVPLSEMQGYVTTLRSMTQGRAASVMIPSHYEEVPQSIAAKLIEKAKPAGRTAQN